MRHLERRRSFALAHQPRLSPAAPVQQGPGVEWLRSDNPNGDVNIEDAEERLGLEVRMPAESTDLEPPPAWRFPSSDSEVCWSPIYPLETLPAPCMEATARKPRDWTPCAPSAAGASVAPRVGSRSFAHAEEPSADDPMGGEPHSTLVVAHYLPRSLCPVRIAPYHKMWGRAPYGTEGAQMSRICPATGSTAVHTPGSTSVTRQGRFQPVHRHMPSGRSLSQTKVICLT
jgi:hypothetical protein